MAEEEEIFEAAAALPAGARTAYLDEVCAGSPELRTLIERLLRSHDATGFMAEPPDIPLLPVEESGTIIGRYKLVQELGRGGFGSVWMAEQEMPIRRRVALKIIKAGMDTRDVIARFEGERQALAMMDHPHIAHIFDAGETATGRPYFVMELVTGLPITQFCDEHRFTTRQRLDLFSEVCSAVTHAHQKGVIHRDIKPSNILVGTGNGKPDPKVIDFGIAKATSGRLSDFTVVTRRQDCVGTPAYMSPEQAALDGMDIDTRSDIYSLGVVLYELLSGKPPLDPATLRKVGYDEMRRMIREVEPRRPSARIGTSTGEERIALTKSHGVEPGDLHRLVKPELDWIVMKAIDKDRTRRYQTVNGLAMDIQRFLGHQPVSASPPSAAYRFRKFARRHRIGLAAAVTALLSVVTFLWLHIRANQAEREQDRFRLVAEAETAKAEAERLRADSNEEKASLLLQFTYAKDMNRVQESLKTGDIGSARRVLDDHRPKEGETDLRGWEWRYLYEAVRSHAIARLGRTDPQATSAGSDQSGEAGDAFGSPVVSADFSRDGDHLLLGFSDGQIELWSSSNGQWQNHRMVQKPFGLPAHVAFSPTDNALAAIVSQNEVKVLQVDTAVETHLCDADGYVRDIAWSADGEWLAVLDASHNPPALGVIRADGLPVMNRTLPSGKGFFFHNVRFSPDGERVYVSCGGTLVPHVLCLSSRDADAAPFWTYTLEPIDENDPAAILDRGFSAMAISPDGKSLALGTGFGDPAIRVLDTGSGRLIRKLTGHSKYVLQLAFSADGQVLASSSEDQTVRLWNPETWTRYRQPLRGHAQEVNALAFSPVGGLLVSGGKDGEILLWDYQAAQQYRIRHDLPAELQEILPLPVRHLAAGRTPDDSWWLVDLRTGALSEEPLAKQDMRPDGSRPAFVVSPRPPPGWDRASGLQGNPRDCAISPDGKQLVMVAESGEFAFYRAENLERTSPVFRCRLGSIFGVTYSPDGKRVVLSSGGTDGIVIWDLETQQELLSLTTPHKLLAEVAFSDDGSTLFASGREGQCQFWTPPTFEEIDAAERAGGQWPMATAFASPPSPPRPTIDDWRPLLEAALRTMCAPPPVRTPGAIKRRIQSLETLSDWFDQQHREAEAIPLRHELLEELKQPEPRNDDELPKTAKTLLRTTLNAEHPPEVAGVPGNLPDQPIDDISEALERLFRNHQRRIPERLILGRWLGRDSETDWNALLDRRTERAEQTVTDPEIPGDAAYGAALLSSHPALYRESATRAETAAGQSMDDKMIGWNQYIRELASHRAAGGAEGQGASQPLNSHSSALTSISPQPANRIDNTI